MIERLHLLLWLNLLALWPVLAAHPCASCHAKEVAGYQKTGMGRSLHRVSRQPAGEFTHAVSGSEFTIRSGPQGMTHTLEREAVSGTFNVDYVIGSGNHAFGYLVNVGGYLFQSPVSYYSQRRVWDMAPGYEADRNPDFTRPVTAECLWCHSGKPLPVSKTLNKYEQPAFAQEAISCDRCHGPVAEHVQRPSAANIVNPRRLAARARDSVCEQCHLSGEVRIANPGKQIGDFQPGQVLEGVFSVYVFEDPADSGLKVISHVQQLARSACQIKSAGKLWCGTCHDPHDKPANPAAHYRTRCLECHRGIQKTHAEPVDDCVRCHMPARRAKDGGHTAFTDHQIQRKPAPTTATRTATKLIAWHQPAEDLRTRNLGLAYLTVGERDRSAFHMDEALRLLTETRAKFASDPAVLTSLGLLALRQRRTSEALALFEGALESYPNYAPYHVNLGTALKEAGRTEEAIGHLEKAIALDPSLEAAYRRLGEIMRQQRKPEEMRAVFDRYLEFMPNNVTARIALQSQ
jgi:hypothetical protein